MITLASNNSTALSSPSDYVALLGNLYRRKEIKYDIVFYFNFFLDDYDKYFINFYDYFDDEYISMYDSQVLALTCIKNDKLVGFVSF